MAGGFAGGGVGDAGNVEISARLVESGKDAVADLTGLVDGTFGEEDDNLAVFFVGTLGDEERKREMGAELALKFLGLDLQTSRANDVIFSSDNPKFRIIRR